VSVNAQSVPWPEHEEGYPAVRRSDPGAVILCSMDNDAIVTINRFVGGGSFSAWYRVHGTRGLMENCRETGRWNMLKVWHEEGNMQPGDVREMIYQPEFPFMKELAKTAGHGGSDLFLMYYFAEAIRQNEQPWSDVYRGLAMSVVGIQAWRSCLANGAFFEIPDFRDEAVRKKYEHDHWSPFPEDAGADQPPPSIRGDISPNAAQLAWAHEIWAEMGYSDG
jgi:hypothetical protein